MNANQKKFNDSLKLKAQKRREKVRAMRESGMQWAEIAKRLKVSTQRAFQIGTKE